MDLLRFYATDERNWNNFKFFKKPLQNCFRYPSVFFDFCNKREQILVRIWVTLEYFRYRRVLEIWNSSFEII